MILNALRVLLPEGQEVRLENEGADLAHRFSSEHLAIQADLDQLRQAADALDIEPGPEAIARVRRVHRVLIDEVLPHELTPRSPTLSVSLAGSSTTSIRRHPPEPTSPSCGASSTGSMRSCGSTPRRRKRARSAKDRTRGTRLSISIG